MRDLQAAVPLLERSLKITPDDPETHYYLGSAYYDLEKSRDAQAHLARAAEKAPEGAPWRVAAYRQLGYAARANNDNRAALAAWGTYLELDTKDSPERRDVQRLMLRAGGH
jgi:tetratricopeptide (TPR) repeat protein